MVGQITGLKDALCLEMSKHIIVGMAWTMREFLMCSSVDCPIHETQGIHAYEEEKFFRFIFGDPICTVLRQNSAEILMIHGFYPGNWVLSYPNFWSEEISLPNETRLL